MPKFTSSLIHNGLRFLAGPSTIICDDDGTIIDVLEGVQHPDAKVLQGLICPGFINAHCHLELSYLHKQIPKHTGLVKFIEQVSTIRNNFSEQEINVAIINAEAQMKANGIVAVGDICNTTYTAMQKKQRNIQYNNFIEVAGVMDSNAVDRYKAVQLLQQQMVVDFATTIVPHAPYSVSQKLFELINSTINNNPISIHNQESQAEDDLIRHANGEMIPFLQKISNNSFVAEAKNRSSLQYALPMLPTNSILFVHNTFTTNTDVDFAIHHCDNRHWVYCANANLYISNQLPSIYNYLDSMHENICIGTDSLASNDELSMLAEIKTIHQHQQFSTETLLRWATSNGAKALNMPYIGEIAVGKKPGLLQVSNWVDRDIIPASVDIKILSNA
jgi:aminodeoxyfutalosine deaminase